MSRTFPSKFIALSNSHSFEPRVKDKRPYFTTIYEQASSTYCVNSSLICLLFFIQLDSHQNLERQRERKFQHSGTQLKRATLPIRFAATIALCSSTVIARLSIIVNPSFVNVEVWRLSRAEELRFQKECPRSRVRQWASFARHKPGGRSRRGRFRHLQAHQWSGERAQLL